MINIVENNEKFLSNKNLKIFLSEIIGTFLLVTGILLPGAIGVNLPPELHSWGSTGWWNFINCIFGLIIVKAAWVATLIIGLIFLFRRWSVNLNPSVTMSEMVVGNDSYYVGWTKIGLQFISGISAAFFMASIVNITSSSTDNFVDAFKNGYNLDAIHPLYRYFNYGSVQFIDADGASSVYTSIDLTGANNSWYWFLSIGIEALFTLGLILSVFWGKNISKNKRALIISTYVWVILLVGLRTNNIALNPARLMGPAISEYILTNGQSKALTFSWLYLIGELLAVVIFMGIMNWNKKEIKISDTFNEFKGIIYIDKEKVDEGKDILNSIQENLNKENLFLKVENEHLKHGNIPFEKMNDNDLFKLVKNISREDFNFLSNEEKIKLVKKNLSEKYINLDITREAKLSKEIIGLKSNKLERTEINNIELSKKEKTEFEKIINDDILEEEDFSKLTIADLKKKLNLKNIKYTAKATKRDLIELLEEDLIKNQNKN